jgi:FtsZ-interacting cell division protein ZipA
MSDLHISLAIAGLLVVIGVYAFNRYQESKFRRQSERDFDGGEEDVLLERADEASLHEERREPSMDLAGEPFDDVEGEHVAAEASPFAPDLPLENAGEKVPASTMEAEMPAQAMLDEVVDYVVAIYPKEPVAATVLLDLEKKFAGFARSLRLLGQNVFTNSLEQVASGKHTYGKLLIVLQLVNRSGPISAAELEDFCGRAQALADDLAAMVDLPDRAAALARAATLDEFCVSVDVLIGVNVVTANGDVIPATKIRALAEASGMKLKADGTFHFTGDDNTPLYSLTNFEPTPFSSDSIRHLSTHGVTLLLDVPVIANGARVFDQMLVLARQMAGSLGAMLVDDNRRPLSDAGVAKIKQQLATIYAKMDAAGIPAGGERAQRLFS